MKTETEFLEKLNEEIRTAQYGEGLSYNLGQIESMIKGRIRALKFIEAKNSKQKTEAPQ